MDQVGALVFERDIADPRTFFNAIFFFREHTLPIATQPGGPLKDVFQLNVLVDHEAACFLLSYGLPEPRRNVLAFSELTMRQMLCPATNRQKARSKRPDNMPLTSSKYTALVTTQVSRKMYDFRILCLHLVRTVQMKSIPVTF